MTNTQTRPARATQLRSWAGPVVLVCGVMLAPFLLTIAFNSFSPPDAAAYVRMAFATVAGQTVALVTVAALFVTRITSHARPSETITYGLIGVAVTVSAVWNINGASDLLLQRLAIG